MTSPNELLDASLLFLDRHERALDPGEPRRALEACEGLHTGLCTTLAEEVSRARSQPHDERTRWALEAVRKRVQESEGVLMHLMLTLRKGTADGPALAAFQRRVALEMVELRACLAALRGALRAYAGKRETPAPRDALRMARACLAMGASEAAAALVALAGVPEAATLARSAPLDATTVWRAHDVAQRVIDVGVPVVS